ncbi:ring finger and CHY zinc finger domain-containing protein 1 [Exophiala viscosa]|uniref:ring finger and CHY zinc finger domain-containing protein 1 n=1 Tax=Exophiala viscosa TaxID=2486360 RepID=UPI0021952B68|nr:ring finger and CHY zinc finger domain-containing protein 1 [Exophiala viscosa]
MSEYLPSFIVEPVLRQARRFSRLSAAEDSPSPAPGFLPAVPDLQRWYPTRFWNSSSPPPLEEPEPDNKETTVQSITRTIQLWAAQLNSFDQIPSPTLEPMEDDLAHDVTQLDSREESESIEFPPLDPEPVQFSRPVVREDQRTSSETSLNPAQELSYRARRLQEHTRPHSLSDPLAAVHHELTMSRVSETRREGHGNHAYRRRDGSGALPEDDGMGPLRQKISGVWAGSGTAAEKSKLVHGLMMERYQTVQALRSPKQLPSKVLSAPQRPATPSSIMSGASQEVVYNLIPEDLVPTYAPLDPEPSHDDMDTTEEAHRPDLGCIHYKRNVKMQCNTCQRWYTCRLCHDEDENHILPRRETKHMLCMLCGTPQPVGQFCKMCHVQAACYYCAVCKLWSNDPAKSIYHCDDCGICRIGEGLGKDFFHCKTCAACMSIQAESTHKCIERSTKCDCPICGEYMFTSNKPVAFMRCGHSIHETCFAEWCNASYKCPICSKSIANMESQFRRLDRHIEEQPMPEEYRDNRAYVFCNDCNSRSVTKYHWLGLKCALCDSYNTTQLELLGAEQTPQLEQEQERAQQAGISEAAITASQNHTPMEELTQPANLTRPVAASALSPIDTAIGAQSPESRSSWLLPHSPTGRSARSMSPAVGSYFGTGQRPAETVPVPRRGTTPLDDDDHLDFWGRPNSPPRHEAMQVESESESGSDSDQLMEDEDDGDEEEDLMALPGHR